jgi:acyl carrier protein
VPEPEPTITAAIRELLERRGAGHLDVTAQATLSGDLDLDSLELAELSAALEDELGHDPYSEGLAPETVGDLVGYYRSEPAR